MDEGHLREPGDDMPVNGAQRYVPGSDAFNVLARENEARFRSARSAIGPEYPDLYLASRQTAQADGFDRDHAAFRLPPDWTPSTSAESEASIPASCRCLSANSSEKENSPPSRER